jgi:hypothetical protein
VSSRQTEDVGLALLPFAYHLLMSAHVALDANRVDYFSDPVAQRRGIQGDPFLFTDRADRFPPLLDSSVACRSSKRSRASLARDMGMAFAGRVRMQLRASPVPPDVLRNLPTPARRLVDGADVLVPQGFEVEPLVVGLSFPCGMGFAEDWLSSHPSRNGATSPARFNHELRGTTAVRRTDRLQPRLGRSASRRSNGRGSMSAWTASNFVICCSTLTALSAHPVACTTSTA